MSLCGYEMAYRGPCKNPSARGERCAEHAKELCVSCGRPAFRECSYAGQFVCGAPLSRLYREKTAEVDRLRAELAEVRERKLKMDLEMQRIRDFVGFEHNDLAQRVRESFRIEQERWQEKLARRDAALLAASVAIQEAMTHLDNPPGASHQEMARRNVLAWKALFDFSRAALAPVPEEPKEKPDA